MGLLSKALSRAKQRLAGGSDSPAATLRISGLVDAKWYLATYKEVADAGCDPVADYLELGARAGRNPNPMFDTGFYLERNPDVREAGINPLVHFVEAGAAEGRSPGPDFDTRFYLATNPAVAAAGINPLAHYLAHGRHEGRLPRPRDPLDAYEAVVRARRTGSHQGDMDHVHFPLHGPTGERDERGMALPPLALAQRIGAPTLDEFELIGRETRRTILRCLPETFEFRGARVLDFGCGVGRVLRYFSEEATSAEVWGCDIDGPSIRWNVENLGSTFRFFQLSEIPTIPLEDSSFDLVYAISVFAHIHIDWHHWMAEVRRILKPGGYFFVTFMAQTPYEEMLGRSYWDFGPDFGKYVQNPFADWNAGGPMAFHSPEWIKTFWGNLFDIEFIALDGLLEYQSICLMRKPEPGPSATGQTVPVLKNSTTQAFDPDAVGRIFASYDQTRPYRDSYGIEANGTSEIRGWIVFRDDAPAELVASVDGVEIATAAEFRPGGAYRDWPDSLVNAFAASVELSGIAAGEHRLEIRVRSRRGRTHSMSIPLIARPREP